MLTYDLQLTNAYVLQNFTCTISGTCGDSSFSCTVPVKGRAEAVLFQIPNAKLWWPKHYGAPTIYNVNIELVSADGKLVIADDTKPIGLAGIMGGENSEIMDDTTMVVFESANFNGTSIRQTALALGMRTEASGKFEKNLDPMMTIPAVQRA